MFLCHLLYSYCHYSPFIVPSSSPDPLLWILYFAIFLSVFHRVPNMITRQSDYIINIRGIAGKNTFKTGTLYTATKHIIQGFT
ncbi:MAG: SDR family NAD(P)-dependent oxidoreductase [Candidatus Hodarchaeales archaeon]